MPKGATYVTVGVAAGHPATAEAGLSILDAGGSAADAAVSAVLASCVTETVLTGIGGGGFATHYDAATGTVTCLDFFCSVPGLGATSAPGPMRPVEISFGGVPQQFSIGGASVAVPGVPAGVAALHRRWGRLPWRDVVAPAIALADRGVALPAAHAGALAAVAPAMLPGAGGATYAPGGRLLTGGELLYHPGLAETLDVLAGYGPGAYYTGPLGAGITAAVRDGGGVLTAADLAAYRVRTQPVDVAEIAGHFAHGRRDLGRTVATLATLPPTMSKLPADERAVALADALVTYGPQGRGCTTNISVVDAAGDACVVTTTLGVGSGVWIPGTGIHLNSMLGEGELMLPGLRAGQRMPSNMCPLVVVDDEGALVLAAGSAGASRIRSALTHTLVNVLVAGMDVPSAIARPRFHVISDVAGASPVVHAEAGYPAAELAALEAARYRVNRWNHQDHYFGGVSAVGSAGAAGDPRRDGVGVIVSPPAGRIPRQRTAPDRRDPLRARPPAG